MILMTKTKRIPTGSVFQQSYRNRAGEYQLTKTWYVKYYSGGKAIVASTGSESYEEALAILRGKQAKAARYGDHDGKLEKVRVGHLLDLLIESYKTKKRRSLYDTQLRIDKHLRPVFGPMLAQSLGTSALRRYVQDRQKEKASAATINKEMAWLRHSLKLGAQEDPPLVERVPHFPMLSVDNAREGTLAHEQYRAVRDLLPTYARIALVIGYHTGARKGEIVSIKIEYVDLKARRIRRPGATTKNGRPRYLPIYGDMAAELEMALSAADPKCAYLLQEDGKRVHAFVKSWKTACKGAGVPGALFHDLRRTAATNMIEAGLSEREAMEVTGHRTRSMFDRYHIVSERRLQALGDKLGTHMKTKDISVPKEATN